MHRDWIINKQFSKAFLGYDVEEVDAFLDEIVRQLDVMTQQAEVDSLRIKHLLEELDRYGLIEGGEVQANEYLLDEGDSSNEDNAGYYEAESEYEAEGENEAGSELSQEQSSELPTVPPEDEANINEPPAKVEVKAQRLPDMNRWRSIPRISPATRLLQAYAEELKESADYTKQN